MINIKIFTLKLQILNSSKYFSVHTKFSNHKSNMIVKQIEKQLHVKIAMCLFDFTIMHSFGHRSKIENLTHSQHFHIPLILHQSCQLTFESSLPPPSPHQPLCTLCIMRGFSLSLPPLARQHCSILNHSLQLRWLKKLLRVLKKLLQLLIAKVPCSTQVLLALHIEIIKTVENYYCFIFFYFFFLFCVQL